MPYVAPGVAVLAKTCAEASISSSCATLPLEDVGFLTYSVSVKYRLPYSPARRSGSSGNSKRSRIGVFFSTLP